MTKVCVRCAWEKPTTDFHKCSKAQDGYRSTCKACRIVETREYNSRPETKDRLRRYRKSPAGIESKKKYQTSEYGRRAKVEREKRRRLKDPTFKERRARYMRDWLRSEDGKRSRMKIRARHFRDGQAKAYNAVKRALRSGDLVRKPCCVCGDAKSHGHHTDYSRPLDVTWLCAKHHGEEHAR